MGTETKGKESHTDQKLGLALSGGGFRAAFFHLGVLAQMAKQGLLSKVEVISTVSGGSIIGALYYLHVRKLLQTKPDADIDDKDYVAITEQIEKDFLKGVQRNLRCLAFANLSKNWRMGRQDYSVSDRLGELYDEHFYRPIAAPDSTSMIQIKDLKILPISSEETKAKDFDPRKDNFARRAKVPILVINATALNSGHNWRFEAARMGEPPLVDPIECDADKNLRLLRPPSYDVIAERQQDFELGLAVAASACAPGIFHPLAVSDLYQGVRVQLVDGGVHDNQGIEGLIENGCNLMILSDACGQMDNDDNPNTWFGAVLTRTSSILKDRVREEQLFHLLRDPNRQVAFFHLREELQPTTLPWLRANNLPYSGSYPVCPAPPSDVCSFNVKVKVQKLLSKVRTDLDSFTEVEASSLMMDGYLISEKVLNSTMGFKSTLNAQDQPDGGRWNFLRIAPWLENPTSDYLCQLHTSQFKFFKAFLLYKLLLVPAAALLLFLLWVLLFSSLAGIQFGFSIRGIFIAVLIAVAGFLLPRLSRMFAILKFLRLPIQFVASYVGQAIIPIAKALFFWLNLKLIDPIYLKMGRIDRLSKIE